MILKKTPLFAIIIFVVSSVLMISLAWVNDGAANDDHIEVAELIFYEGKIPEPQKCWQCYHPKFYHYSVAKLSQFFGLENRAKRTILAQVINAIAGIFTLFIFWNFIQRQPFQNHVKLLCFATIALNPRFIAINAQASNDSFSILFGTIILFSIYRLVDKLTIKYFLLLLVAAILVGVTKGSSWILFTGVVVAFLLKIILNRKVRWTSYLGSLLLFVFINILLVGYFGEYYNNYKKYGKPVVYNTPITELPNMFDKTTFRRPGVESIAEGYFTFRWFDLIQNPMISNDSNDYPLHRTSVWSQLYGRAHFIYFDNWPPGKWQTTSPMMMNLGRVSLGLAIIPTLLFLLGYFRDLKKWLKLFFKKEWGKLNFNTEWIFHVFIFGFIMFIILFTATGRDYSFMKVIYLYPCLLAMLISLLKGFEYGFRFLDGNRFRISVFYFLIISLFIVYLIPILNLISNLAIV